MVLDVIQWVIKGVLVMWYKTMVEKMDECVGEFTLAISFKNVADGSLWAIVRIYGPNSNTLRRLMWDELLGLCSLWDVPWCIVEILIVT